MLLYQQLTMSIALDTWFSTSIWKGAGGGVKLGVKEKEERKVISFGDVCLYH